ncbi:MAG: four helix bundle protein [Myxococcales bacterium]|nr:four helix bundle protein [Myxococcales bacterium]
MAWHLAAELVRLVFEIRISDADDRREARRAAKSCARNVAEGAGRTSRADKARVYAIARGECGERVASVELAAATGGCSAADVARVTALGSRLSGMLYRMSWLASTFPRRPRLGAPPLPPPRPAPAARSPRVFRTPDASQGA